MATIQQILKDARAHMDKAIDSVKHEFASVRSSKATTNMLDTVRVEVYGTQMMLNQVASVAAPEPRLLTVTPFDKSQIKVIEKAIREAELGLDPVTQGAMIRVPLPQMNEERRKDLVKIVHKFAGGLKLANVSRSSTVFQKTTSSTPRRICRRSTTSISRRSTRS
jgi:ribosome recycling factor